MKKERYSRRNLEYRAAQYYSQIRLPKKDWKTIADLEPQLLEFEHCIRACAYDEAAQSLNEIDFNYLMLWGHVRRVVTMREQLTGKIKDPQLNGMHLSYLGYAFYALSQYEDAIETLEAALRIHQATENTLGEIFTTGNMGRVYHHSGRFRLAIEYYERAVDLARRVNAEAEVSAFLANMGIVYSMMGQCDRAVECGKEALRSAQNKRDKARALSNLGLAHRGLGEYEQAKEYLEEALSIAYVIDDKRGQSFRLGHIGDLYQESGQYQKAIECHGDGLEAAMEAKSLKLEGERLFGLGLANLAIKNYEEAVTVLSLALEIASEIQNARNEDDSRVALAQAYLHLDQPLAALDALGDVHSKSNLRAGFLRGLILARLGREEESQSAFDATIRYARQSIGIRPGSYASKYVGGLSLVGLALTSELPEQSRMLPGAQELLREARGTNDSTGVVEDAIRLLEELEHLDKAGILKPMRRILEGD